MKMINPAGSAGAVLLTLGLLSSGARASESHIGGGGGGTARSAEGTLVVAVAASESDVLRWEAEAERRGFQGSLLAADRLILQAAAARKAAPAVAQATREAVAALKEPVPPAQSQTVAACAGTTADADAKEAKCADPDKSSSRQGNTVQPALATVAPGTAPRATAAAVNSAAPNRLPT